MIDRRLTTISQELKSSHGYARLLRPIGQALERFRITSFLIETNPAGFIVHDKTPNRAHWTIRERAFSAEPRCEHNVEKGEGLGSGVFQWRLTESDIERHEREGRAQRRAGGQTPDAHSISHLLRVLGALVDQKGGQLVSVAKDDQVVVLEYGLRGGRIVAERYDMPALYDLGVRMYMKRTGRNRDARLSV